MNFIEALELAKQGKKIRIKTWENTSFYIRLEKNVLHGINDYEFRSFKIDEYMSLDWELYKEKPKLHTFEEALVAYKNGCTIHRDNVYPDNTYNISDKNHPCFFRKQDILAKDWVILDQEETNRGC